MVDETLPSYNDVLRRYFDVTYTEREFIELTAQSLNKIGFNPSNAIACVGVCRDEISQTLVESVNNEWGYAFNLSSLAGMLSAGKTGLLAAMHHAPDLDGKERYVFYSFPHIAIDKDGGIGVCERRGRKHTSTACGALNAFQKELTMEQVNATLDYNDAELGLIRIRLLRDIPEGSAPDLLELTKITQKAIQADLESAIEILVNTNVSNYAIITGIQIHGPDGNYIWPASLYAVIDGLRQEIELN